jgi:hypothetical protein
MAGHSRPKDGVASARLCPAIHAFAAFKQVVDARDKPGHDGAGIDGAADITSHSRDTMRPSFAAVVSRHKKERAQGMPGARCTHGFVQKSTRSSHRLTGFNPAFPAQWFYGFLRDLLGDRLVVTVALKNCFSRT